MLSSRKRKLSDLMKENLELKVGDVSDYLIVDVSNVDSVDYKIPLKSKRSASISVPIDFEEDDIDSIVMWLDLLRGGI